MRYHGMLAALRAGSQTAGVTAGAAAVTVVEFI
jgi:hypothetical protein